MNPGAFAEAQRQQQLLRTLTAPVLQPLPAGLCESPERALRGVQAYRANAHASVARALASAFPTVQAMLGEKAFDSLAATFWHADPPTCGDLGEWGGALPEWLAAQPELAEWPYLADCARVDLAVHRCERAPDAAFDADSFARLGDTEPSRLRLQLLPGSRVIQSRWPVATIASIHQAHRSQDEADFAKVRALIEAEQGEAVLVVRDGWRATVWPVDAAEVAWLRHLEAGDSLDTSLAGAGDAFDFAAWLARAISSRWLKAVAVIAD